MKKISFRRGKPALFIGISILILEVMMSKTTFNVWAAEPPIITALEVKAAPDGQGVIASCHYQNYTNQSGCEARLYLYKVEDGGNSIKAQKALIFTDEGDISTDPAQVEDGIYCASVGMDYGSEIKQVNSVNYYRVENKGGNLEVSKIVEDTQTAKRDFSCCHECDYVSVQKATPIKDETLAYQCMRCGAVLEYVEVSNSAYAAFLKEAAEAIRGTEQEEAIISTDRWMSFNRDVFEAIRCRPDVTVRVHYKYCGEASCLIIPAGADVELLMDENGFGGFRYIEKCFR